MSGSCEAPQPHIALLAMHPFGGWVQLQSTSSYCYRDKTLPSGCLVRMMMLLVAVYNGCTVLLLQDMPSRQGRHQ